MKKIVPIILLVLAAFFLLVGGAGLIAMIAAAKAMPEISIIAVPFILIALVGSMLTVALSVYFKKDILCRIAIFVGGAAFLLSLVGLIIWLVIM